MFLISFVSSNLHISFIGLEVELASRSLYGEGEKIHFHNYISTTKKGKDMCEEKGHKIL